MNQAKKAAQLVLKPWTIRRSCATYLRGPNNNLTTAGHRAEYGANCRFNLEKVMYLGDALARVAWT